MKIIAVFNNKGGVGKSTLSFHLAHALAEQGIKTLMVDLDPQSNLTLQCIEQDSLAKIWQEEELYIEDFEEAQNNSKESFDKFVKNPRSIHCLLKPVEDGVFDHFVMGDVYELSKNLGIIPGRLSLHMFEEKLSKSWSDAFLGDPQALRLITSIRTLCLEAQRKHGYEIAILDTSPSLGILNKIIISLSTGFFVPCSPDMFSTFGLTNIGLSLRSWQHQFSMMQSLLPEKKKKDLPERFVKFLGYTIYNAKKYKTNQHGVAKAHQSYVEKIPEVIRKKIPKECFSHLSEDLIVAPIGAGESDENSIMYSHNTFPAMSQKYRLPMWRIPDCVNLSIEEKSTVQGNQKRYRATQEIYHRFAKEIISRTKGLEN